MGKKKTNNRPHSTLDPINEMPLSPCLPRKYFPFAILTKSNRIQNVIRHRSEINSIGKFFAKLAPGHKSQSRQGRRHFKNEAINPAGEDSPPKFFKKLKPINIRDMDPYQSTHSKGNKITLEIIEDAQAFTRVMLLGQDELGDVVFVALYCDSPSTTDAQLQEKVGFGCKITIANPFMKIALDGRTMIRVEKDRDLFIHRDKDVKKCRCCGKSNARLRCARCKMAHYCSEECQNVDWKVLQHKDVCDAFVNNWMNNMIPQRGRLIGIDMYGGQRSRSRSIWFWPAIILLFVVFCRIYFAL